MEGHVFYSLLLRRTHSWYSKHGLKRFAQVKRSNVLPLQMLLKYTTTHRMTFLDTEIEAEEKEFLRITLFSSRRALHSSCIH